MKEEVTLNECAELIAKLISVDTAQPDGNEARLCELIESRYAARSELRLTRLEHGDGRSSLVIEAGPAGAKTTAFCGHLDTVASGPLAAWNGDPFAARFEGDAVYGRGASDMKSGVAAMLLALDRLDAAPLKRRLVFCFTADEEKGGTGASAIAKSGALDGMTELFVCEPSSGDIGLCEKGALWLRLSAAGRSSHGSRPDLGDNAAEKLISFIDGARGLIRGAAHPLLGENTAALTGFTSGILVNVVPDFAEATLDIRTVPPTSNAGLLDEISAAAPSGVSVERLNDRPALETRSDEPFVRRVRRLALASGLAARDKGICYYTDASLIIPEYPVSFVIFGPGDDAQCHTANERASVSDIARFAELYLAYIEKFC